MKRLAWWAALAGCGLAAVGQARVHVLAGPVVLRHLPPVAHGVEAMPEVVAGAGVTAEVAAKINAALRRVDAKVRVAARQCTGKDREWTRSVDVTMLGPRYLSVTAADELDCGGPHPDEAFLPLVYDLNTGGTVNWLKLLPPGVSGGVDDAADGSKVGAVIWPALTAMARTQAEADCKDAFDRADAVPFVLWLDAKAGAIEAAPDGFPHALAPCEVPVVITVAQARKMGGFSAELLDALEAAHGLQR
jgi:hypothetical protein